MCVCDGTGILFEEPNPTGSRPSDLIGLYEMARKAKGTVTFHTRLKQEEATALVYLYTSLQHSISALVLAGAQNPFSVKNKKIRSANWGEGMRGTHRSLRVVFIHVSKGTCTIKNGLNAHFHGCAGPP